MGSVIRRSARLVALVVFEAAGTWFLLQPAPDADLAIPWNHLGPWWENASPERAVAGFVHTLALGGMAWLIVTTIGYLGARSLGASRTAVALGAATMPVVRTAVDRALAVSLVSAALVVAPSAARAAEPPQPPRPVPTDAPRGVGSPPGIDGVGYTPVPAGLPTPGTLPPHPPAHQTPPTAPRMHVVVPGDSLWRIAASDANAGDEVGEVAGWWLQIIDLNRSRLRSGDPDLIYPGEVIVLPDRTGRSG
ncbi:MAG: LysM peptidoglycan-binding domain-containing protein [Acidimicrobiia bacterium]